MVDPPTKRRARCPVGRAEGTNDKQDHDSHAADFCARTEMRFHIGAHRNAPRPSTSATPWRNRQSPSLILGVWPICAIQPPRDFGSLPQPHSGWGSVMGLDTGTVFKRSVLCPHCNEDYLFTLRAIADNPELKCLGCGGSIRLGDSMYKPLLSEVRNTLEAVDTAQLTPTFVSVHSSSPSNSLL